MVLVLIAGVVSVRVINSDRTPEAAVREYVQLIADGKYDAASKLVDPGVNSYQRRLFERIKLIVELKARLKLTL